MGAISLLNGRPDGVSIEHLERCFYGADNLEDIRCDSTTKIILKRILSVETFAKTQIRYSSLPTDTDFKFCTLKTGAQYILR